MSLPFLTKKFTSDRADVFVNVYVPELYQQTYQCSYEIGLNDEVLLKSYASGEDTVQALLLALWKIEIELNHRVPFKGLKIERNWVGGFGFIHTKEVWDSIYK